jgi:hypothetical protein
MALHLVGVSRWLPGNAYGMTALPDDVDPAIGEHVAAIRDRFGLEGLRQAEQLIEMEIAIFADSYVELAKSTEPDGPSGGERGVLDRN